jgi:hypothetical protein
LLGIMVTFPQNSYVYRLASALLHSCRTMAPERVRDVLLPSTYYLQNEIFWEWAMLGSNQRPLPCEVRSLMSWLFTGVQKTLQNRPFTAGCIRLCSWLFVWVGVLIGVVRVSRVRDYLHYTWAYGQLSPMAVAYPHVLSVCMAGRVKARGKGPRLKASALPYC